jgi:DNA-binding transcriptional MerR regulator
MSDRLYTRREVAEMFRVNILTVMRWEQAGRLKRQTTTPGGHVRYSADAIDKLREITDRNREKTEGNR